MIPKRIHYIWLGGNEKPNIVNICINSWKKELSDYEIIEWNESNLDLEAIASDNKFFKECKKRKLWAYMADYLRLKILYEYGGIYLDTDVQVLKSFNSLLNVDSFIGYEAEGYVGTGVIASIKGSSSIKSFLEFYDDEIWKSKLFTTPQIISEIIGREEAIGITVFPQDYFAPYNPYKGYHDSDITESTFCIHWYNAGWTDNPGIRNFLEVKHIRNPFIRRCVIFRKNIRHILRTMMR